MDTQRVIKAEAIRELGRRVAFNLEDFRKHCDDQVSKTQEQAVSLINDARDQAGAIEQTARVEGYQAGYAEGLKNAQTEVERRAAAEAKTRVQRELQGPLAAVRAVASALNDAKISWLSRWETAAIRLGAAIAERILKTELAHRPDLGPAMIRNLLQLASGLNDLRVRVHPADAEALGGERLSLQSRLGTAGTVEFISDQMLRRGDCIIESEHGVLDGRLHVQLQRILVELLPDERPSTHGLS